jgi:lactobin A/cerein 7B family class IIb bacteriocin
MSQEKISDLPEGNDKSAVELDQAELDKVSGGLGPAAIGGAAKIGSMGSMGSTNATQIVFTGDEVDSQ